MKRSTTTGHFQLALEPADAIGLFTAEGERDWIPGWVPTYPEPGAVHDAVGTVFQRTDPSGEMTFVVVDNGPGWRRYARYAEGMTMGIVEVVCTALPEGGTDVAVTFDLTALTPEGEEWLAKHHAFSPQIPAQWRDWITAGIPGA